MTRFENKSVAALGLVILAICIIVQTTSAKDYSTAETVAKNLLIDPANNLGILSANVSINDQQVTISCITHISVQEEGAPLAEFGTFLGGVLGIYMSLVSAEPDVGDLVIVMKNKNQPTVSTLSCPKSWIIGLDDMNADAVQQLMTKVFLTMKKA
jgi:hypothetical protein